MNNYTHIIIGGGPSGLTMAHLLSKIKSNNILILESEDVLGGCHRVERVDEGKFSEHSPRVYSFCYTNFDRLLKEMGTSLDEEFVVYDSSISNIGSYSIADFSVTEQLSLVLAFFKMMIWPDYGRDISLSEFSINFSEKSRDYLDRLSRLTDGAGIETYSLNKFLSIINDQSLHSILQPREPNDRGFLKKWQEYLLNQGNVTIKTNTRIVSINPSSTGPYIESIVDDRGNIYYMGNRTSHSEATSSATSPGSSLILAIQPEPIQRILENSTNLLVKDAFGPYSLFSQYAHDTLYIDYIPLTLHYKDRQKLPDVYGFPGSDWGLTWIILSDYMKDVDNNSDGTVITAAITITDRPSKRTGKTANQSTAEELKEEAFNQLKLSFPDLKWPDYMILSPTVYKDSNDRWTTKDKAFVETVKGREFIPFRSLVFDNLYNVGTQNGYSKYQFTSLESAVSNAFVLGSELTGLNYPVLQTTTIRDVLFWTLVVILFLMYLYMRRKIDYKFTKKKLHY